MPDYLQENENTGAYLILFSRWFNTNVKID